MPLTCIFTLDHAPGSGLAAERECHAAARTQAIFDDEHVISYGGPASAMRLAERCGLERLVDAHVTLSAARPRRCP
ncbi:hypothetical protein ACQEVF_53710 [Nonomuraea polychroma]|uniref:hypothetical protein n=1 Tax=Nonomuraea polychroma TaxID=46176 RepID=UPI003D91033F